MDDTAIRSQPLSRREFLYYAWGASMALLMAEAGGALAWLALPRFKANEFGGVFEVPIEQAPQPGSPPVEFATGRFWLVNLDDRDVTDPRHPPGYQPQPGLLALYKVCVHLGCLYQWKPTNGQFECPCHGSKYLKDGTRVHQPATRDLDRLVVRAVAAQGEVLSETKRGDMDEDGTSGQPIPVPPGTTILQIYTGTRLKGRRNSGRNTVE
jgi:cytochrome b6-f complex iron-sulfur subunit